MTSFSVGHFLGNPASPNITVVDTPGFKVMIFINLPFLILLHILLIFDMETIKMHYYQYSILVFFIRLVDEVTTTKICSDLTIYRIWMSFYGIFNGNSQLRLIKKIKKINLFFPNS